MPRKDRIDRSGPRAIKKAEDKAKALQLRVEGNNYRQIAEKLGIAESWAFTLVNEAIEDIPKESRDLIFWREVQRLEEAARALHPLMIQGDTKAAGEWLKMHDRISKLFHLDKHMASQQDNGEGAIAQFSEAVARMYEMQKNNEGEQ